MFCSTWSMVELKTRFETWITNNDVSGVSLFNLSYLITHLRSQRSPYVQIKYFMFDWSICWLFVLNRVWKRDSLQIMIFAYSCSTWGIVELKMRFQAWITKNEVNGESLFHLPYLIIIMAYLCSKRHQMYKSSILGLIVRSTDYMCLLRVGNVTLSKWWYSKRFARHEAWLKLKLVLKRE
jgi:hypothetical protein